MKHIEKLIIATLSIIILSGCYDRDIIDRKEFNHTLPKVENLSYTQQGNVISLSWQLPNNIPADFTRPLAIKIQVVENDIYRQIVTVSNESNSAEITINQNNKYKFIVKLLGTLTDDAKEEGFTDKVYSEGVIVIIE